MSRNKLPTCAQMRNYTLQQNNTHTHPPNDLVKHELRLTHASKETDLASAQSFVNASKMELSK